MTCAHVNPSQDGQPDERHTEENRPELPQQEEAPDNDHKIEDGAEAKKAIDNGLFSKGDNKEDGKTQPHQGENKKQKPKRLGCSFVADSDSDDSKVSDVSDEVSKLEVNDKATQKKSVKEDAVKEDAVNKETVKEAIDGAVDWTFIPYDPDNEESVESTSDDSDDNHEEEHRKRHRSSSAEGQSMQKRPLVKTSCATDSMGAGSIANDDCATAGPQDAEDTTPTSPMPDPKDGDKK